MAEDENFWLNCPKLEGDWPNIWKHGWVYDWETLRMNVRRPIAICILNQNGQILFSSEEKKNMRKISFEVQNGRRYRIESLIKEGTMVD